MLWEFVKILTYQSRFFTRREIDDISTASNLPMYWPSRAFDSVGQPDTSWNCGLAHDSILGDSILGDSISGPSMPSTASMLRGTTAHSS